MLILCGIEKKSAKYPIEGRGYCVDEVSKHKDGIRMKFCQKSGFLKHKAITPSFTPNADRFQSHALMKVVKPWTCSRARRICLLMCVDFIGACDSAGCGALIRVKKASVSLDMCSRALWYVRSAPDVDGLANCVRVWVCNVQSCIEAKYRPLHILVPVSIVYAWYDGMLVAFLIGMSVMRLCFCMGE
ncbi:unnamed protein product [Thelazia callipaeda]|uniref:Transmembrane protein n=1 Tax=Thelazia callipaeda TaxID=103827 RepID=A0A0N5DAS0_THECL|nr:unnamed protein product [Thelazia callipaeda]